MKTEKLSMTDEQCVESLNNNFMKAMIKIANPTWTSEQIQSEYERKLKEVKENPDDCEMCSG